eukprot:9868380-Karenia_brevis.AAC.1
MSTWCGMLDKSVGKVFLFVPNSMTPNGGEPLTTFMSGTLSEIIGIFNRWTIQRDRDPKLSMPVQLQHHKQHQQAKMMSNQIA